MAGIDIIMITGDPSPTAYAIGRELNLSRGKCLEIMDSAHLSVMDSSTLREHGKGCIHQETMSIRGNPRRIT